MGYLSLRYGAEFRRSRLVFFFFRQTSSCMYNFLQTSLVHVYSSVQSLLGLRRTQRSRVRVLALARIFEHFFRHCATQFFSALCDFSIFFHLQRAPPSSFFDILQQTKVPKSPKGLPFYVFRHYEAVQNSHFSFCFENLKKLIFLSSKDPPSIYLIFCNKLDFQKARISPFYRFKNCAF